MVKTKALVQRPTSSMVDVSSSCGMRHPWLGSIGVSTDMSLTTSVPLGHSDSLGSSHCPGSSRATL
jgi:hypothetical protein